MMNSQLFVGRSVFLETVRIAAYFPKRLNKNLVQMTNIHSSVDAILQDQVLKYGVLGFLLLGIVRIYSRKVQYMWDDCNRLRLELNEFGVKKTTSTINEAMCAPSPSITWPISFELDAFDLQISEDIMCSHVRPSEDLMLEGARKNAEYPCHSVDKNYSPSDGFNSVVFSAAFTPFSEVLSLHLMENEIMSTPTRTFFGSEASIENFRENNIFLLDEMLDPIIRDEVNGEQTRVPNVEEYVGVEEGPSSARADGNEQEMDNVEKIMVSPQHMINHQDSISIDATPKLKEPNASSVGEFSKQYIGVSEGPSSVGAFDDDQEIDTLEKIMVSPESMTDHQDSITIYATPKLKDPNASSVEEFIEEYTGVNEGPSSVGAYDEDQDRDTLEKTTFPVMITPECTTDCPASVTVDETSIFKGTNASGTLTPDFMAVQTPASKEGGRFSRKRKCLVDDVRVLPTSVMRENLANPSDLIRARMIVPHARLHVWKIQKYSNLPHSYLEPIIPCSSVLGSVFSFGNIKKVKLVEATKAPEKVNTLESLIDDRSPEQTVDILEPLIIHQSPDPALNIFEPPIDHQHPDQTDIAPSTPITFTSSKLPNGPRPTIYSDSLEEEEERHVNIEFDTSLHNADINSSAGDSWEKSKGNENIDLDISLTNEDKHSSAGDSWEMDKWTVRTRAAARCLCRNFLSRKKQKENEAKLFEILKGKKKGESARLFYEILVLKSGGYVDVKQRAPYNDIIVVGTCKLKKFSNCG